MARAGLHPAVPYEAYAEGHPVYLEETDGNGQLYGFPMVDGPAGGLKLAYYRQGRSGWYFELRTNRLLRRRRGDRPSSNPDEPGKTQLKYYALGVGGIRTGWRGKNEKEREELELTSQTTLSDTELCSVGKALLAQEKRAYSRRPQVFGPTAHMKQG